MASAAFALLAVFGWRLWTVHRYAIKPGFFFLDTPLYTGTAHYDYLSLDLWVGLRAPIVPLLFKLCGCDPERIVRLAYAAAFVSWSALGLALASRMRRLSRVPLALLALLSLALSDDVVRWNDDLLSESFSTSLFVLLIAVGLAFLGSPRRWALPLVLTAAAFALCRDSNAFVVLLLGLACLVRACVAAFKRRTEGARRVAAAPFVLVGASCLLVFATVTASVERGERWVYSLENVFLIRLFPDPSATQELRAYGMPDGPALHYGRTMFDRQVEPERRAFAAWLQAHGRRAFLSYAFKHPSYLLANPLIHARDWLTPRLERYSAPGFSSAEPPFAQAPWLPSAWLLRAGVAVLLAAVTAARPAMRRSALSIAGLFLIGGVYPHALVVWHADAFEPARHALGVALELELGLLLLVVAWLDSSVASVEPASDVLPAAASTPADMSSAAPKLLRLNKNLFAPTVK